MKFQAAHEKEGRGCTTGEEDGRGHGREVIRDDMNHQQGTGERERAEDTIDQRDGPEALVRLRELRADRPQA